MSFILFDFYLCHVCKSYANYDAIGPQFQCAIFVILCNWICDDQETFLWPVVWNKKRWTSWVPSLRKRGRSRARIAPGLFSFLLVSSLNFAFSFASMSFLNLFFFFFFLFFSYLQYPPLHDTIHVHVVVRPHLLRSTIFIETQVFIITLISA